MMPDLSTVLVGVVVVIGVLAGAYVLEQGTTWPPPPGLKGWWAWLWAWPGDKR